MTKPATAKRAPKAKAAVAVEPVETVEAYKCFGPDLTCRGFKYEVGQTYQHKGAVRICEAGFHAVEMPLDAWNYYPAGSPMAKVTLAGSLLRHNEDSKVCGAAITVTATLDLPAYIKAAVAWVIKAAKGNMATGDSGHAAATGDSGHAAATGYSGHAAATGYRGHAAATGDSGHAAATGEYGIAASLGPNGTATAGATGYIVLSHWNTVSWPYKLTRVERFRIGEDGVEPGKTYRLNADGNVEQVSA